MSLPLVTVLMPVFNSEKHLKEAIESILNQSYTNFIFLIINDGSTDLSEAIIRSYQDERIRYVKNTENIQLIATLNKGIELINTKYIARMDADDIAHPERLEKQISFLEKNPDCIVCGSYYQFIGQSEQIIHLPILNDQIKFQLLYFNSFCHPSTVIRTSVFQENNIKFNKEYKHAEDYFLWTELALKGEFYNIPEVLLYYRKHDSQISQIFQNHQQDIELTIQANYLNKLTGLKLENQIILSTLQFLHFGNKEISSSKLLEAFTFLFDINCSLFIFEDKFLRDRLLSTLKNLIFSMESFTIKDLIKIRRAKFYTNDFLTNKQKLRLLKLILLKK